MQLRWPATRCWVIIKMPHNPHFLNTITRKNHHHTSVTHPTRAKLLTRASLVSHRSIFKFRTPSLRGLRDLHHNTHQPSHNRCDRHDPPLPSRLLHNPPPLLCGRLTPFTAVPSTGPRESTTSPSTRRIDPHGVHRDLWQVTTPSQPLEGTNRWIRYFAAHRPSDRQDIALPLPPMLYCLQESSPHLDHWPDVRETAPTQFAPVSLPCRQASFALVAWISRFPSQPSPPLHTHYIAHDPPLPSDLLSVPLLPPCKRRMPFATIGP